MENKEKILYRYFCGSKKIARIPKDKIHRQKLLDNIKTVHPTFMHPYAFGMMSNEEAKVSKSLIDMFKNNRVSGLRRFAMKVKGFFGE
ncbi:MAG: hypothetical protein ACXAC5_05155 [Promethearchaeota archaeon]|jgi:hypothetical protein